MFEIANYKYYFDEFYPALCVFASKYVGSMDEAYDIVQETFIKCWKSFDRFQTESEVRMFLYTVARNESLNYLKHKKVQMKSQERVAAEMYFKEQVIELELYLLLNRAIAELPPQGRRIIELALEGLKNSEIAIELNISVNTVKTLKSNAYKAIREKLKGTDILVLFTLLMR